MKLKEKIKLLEEKRQQGNSEYKFTFYAQDDQENYSEFTKRAVLGSAVSTEYKSADEVAHVYWAAEDSQAWVHWNRYYLVAMKDGRYAFFSSLSSGTCGYCSSASDDVVFGSSLEEIIRFGMGDTERRMAELELDEDENAQM